MVRRTGCLAGVLIAIATAFGLWWLVASHLGTGDDGPIGFPHALPHGGLMLYDFLYWTLLGACVAGGIPRMLAAYGKLQLGLPAIAPCSSDGTPTA
ncbi:hypothetical protein [Kribbella sp. NPDC049227]|uniref:hypothetical protein n=1 Tax=Kribbella sp. NPDC049227 TaxID=3364113 RepID=UPI00371C4AF4